MLAFFCISTNAPILDSSPTMHPYKLMNFESFTSLPSVTSELIAMYLSISISDIRNVLQVLGERAGGWEGNLGRRSAWPNAKIRDALTRLFAEATRRLLQASGQPVARQRRHSSQ